MKGKVPQPWRRVGQGPCADHRILKVRELTVADPRDGREHQRVVLEAPDWVNVIPVTAEGKVVLVRQFRFGTWGNTLEVPGGMVDPGEDPAQAAARELEEETGYRPRRLEALGACHPNPAIQSNRTFSFLALGCEQVHAGRPDSSEDIAVELCDRAEVDHLIRTGQITHALVLVAFLYERLR